MSDAGQQDIVAADGCRVTARFFTPPGPVLGAVLVVPANGTSQLYYRPFAIWAADQGFLAATFDAISKRASGRRLYWIGRSLGGQILGFVPNGDRIAPEHEDRLWRRHLLPELA